MKSDLKNEEYYLFYLKSIHGLKESLIWEYLKDGFLPKTLYASPPKAIAKLVNASKLNTNFVAKIRQDFLVYKNSLSILDPAYPELLKTIFDPPLFLFYQGNLKLLESKYLLSIVGSRTLTSYHLNTLNSLLTDLAQTPLVIVSGLALGIDSAAHLAALKNNLKTIAVLGSGFDQKVLYPRQNLKLAQDILKNDGLILSEYPPLTKPALYQFPKRNRILAGLSPASIVVSGAEKSGTLITAQCALENGREVFALPGNINLKLCEGPNQLIYQGANILLNSSDILQTYDLIKKTDKKMLDLNNEQKKVYGTLASESLSFDLLQNKLAIKTSDLNKALSQLEIMNLISLNQFNEFEIK
ncbi:DNA-protecting protein DprA [Candidatus Nomurabacteria bacterium]|nr:DNA-protecting protein DprA [Candidatus Nomurabacteria bacterium]